MGDFLLHIPSDFSSETIKDNTISNFKINYDESFKLSLDYECGLVEIIYPTSVRNIPDNIKFKIAFYYQGAQIPVQKFILNSGSYDDSGKLIKSISDLIKTGISTEIKNFLKINVFKDNNIESNIRLILPIIELENEKTKITNGLIQLFNSNDEKIKEEKLYIIFDDYLHLMLGFEERNISKPEGTSKYPIDLFGNIHTLYLYTNIIKESFVGNKKKSNIKGDPPGKNIYR